MTNLAVISSSNKASQLQSACHTLVMLFEQVFGDTYNTRLVSGGLEPEYIPANKDVDFHRIVFAQDYFSSALHEIAHWCVAGEQRRLLSDYGYWYVPDGRNAQQQTAFEQVELKPQALEWMFSKASNIRFRVSADNLEAGSEASEGFKQAIVAQAQHYCTVGVNIRAGLFIDALSKCYQTTGVYNASHYCLEDL